MASDMTILRLFHFRILPASRETGRGRFHEKDTFAYTVTDSVVALEIALTSKK